MVKEDKYWIDINSDKKVENINVCGKWIYFDTFSKIYSMVSKINDLVERGDLQYVKINQKRSEFYPFPNEPYAINFFTNDNPTDIQNIKSVIKTQLNIDLYIWKSDKQTDIDWAKHGWKKIKSDLIETYLANKESKIKNQNKYYRKILYLVNNLEKRLKEVQEPERIAEFTKSKINDLLLKIKEEIHIEKKTTVCNNIIENETNSNGNIQPKNELIERINNLENLVKEMMNNFVVKVNKKFDTSFVKKLISKNQIEEAIKLLYDYFEDTNTDKHNDIILISAQYNSYKRNIALGLMSGEIEINRIRYALLQSID